MPPTPPTTAAVPYVLMPITAMLGLYALYVVGYALYVILVNWKQQRDERLQGDDGKKKRRTMTARERLEKGKNANDSGAVMKIQSNEFALMLFTLLLSLIAYSFLVARVQAAYDRAEYYSFDPYAILGLSSSKTAEPIEPELLQNTFKSKIAEIRSKTADAAALEQVKLAYQALADERGKLSYERFGHPLGQLEVPAFCLTLPSWLLVPTGPFTNVIFVIYGLAVLALLVKTVQTIHQARVAAKKAAAAAAEKPDPSALLDDSNSVGKDDLSFIINHLQPTSQYFDVLATICAAPENIAWSLRDLNKVATIRAERVQKEEEAKAKKDSNTKKKKNDLDFDALVNEGGWDDDDDDDNKEGGGETKSSSGSSSDKEKEGTAGGASAAAGLQAKQLLEGLDDGVLGQKWVESTLAKANAWPPPKADILEKESFEYQGETLPDALDHPGLRRMLCMTMGRLNSSMLNSHPELLQAGANKLIDQTYFKSSMEFRQRVGLRLEATLRLGMTMRSFRLIETTVESVAHFKIGCVKGEKSKQAFQAMMKRQYDCLPELKVHNSAVVTAGEKEVATGDKCAFELEAERMHAEKFLRAKITQCQKQGIPPQVALQGFREGWWMILRYQRLDGPTPDIPIDRDQQLFTTMDPPIVAETLERFDQEDAEHRLLVATPALVANIAQKTGKFQLGFDAPKVPGKYRFILSIKSQDYLGCDQEVRVDVDVVDAATVQRSTKTETKDGDDNEEEQEGEAKKDK